MEDYVEKFRQADALAQNILRLTRNTELCRAVKFDDAHQKLVEEKVEKTDKWQIRSYF